MAGFKGYTSPEVFMKENNFTDLQISKIMNMTLSELANLYDLLNTLEEAISSYNSMWGMYNSLDAYLDDQDTLEDLKVDCITEIYILLGE